MIGLNFRANSQIDFSLYEGERSTVLIEKVYSLINIYDYQIEKAGKDSLIIGNNLQDNLLQELYNKYQNELDRNTTDSVQFTLSLNSRYIIEINKVTYAVIKYKTYNSNGDSSEYLLDRFVFKDQNWSEFTTENQELDKFTMLFENSTIDLLFQFYNYRDNRKYPVVNELKPSVKNEKGLLELDKLTTVIIENKEKLSSFFEE